MTHRSVLLSTITKNAHIHPVNQSNRRYHHIVIQFQFSISDFILLSHFFNSDFSPSFSSLLLLISEKTWKIKAIQKMRTKAALILFMEIAMLSGDSPSHQLLHPVNEKMKAKN